MSDRTSPNWLAFATVVGPIAALANQGLIYAANAWACERGTRTPLHTIAALCLVVAAGTAMWVIRGHWRAMQPSDDVGSERRRTRFMARTAAGTSVFSSLVIVAQWIAVAAFGPCTRT